MSKIFICGVDEAGRGPLCGPVVAAAVILNSSQPIKGLADSKALSEKKRLDLADKIRDRALAWCVAEASVEEIDSLNILHASMLAMARAIRGLSLTPHEVLVDGNRCPEIDIPARAVVQGDALIAEISAASILAKTERDKMLIELDRQWPHYGLAQHKGYPTPGHLAALKQYGPLEIHRRSFAPVRALLVQQELF